MSEVTPTGLEGLFDGVAGVRRLTASVRGAMLSPLVRDGVHSLLPAFDWRLGTT